MKKKIIIKILIIFLLIIVFAMIGLIIWYKTSINPVNKKNGQVTRIEIEEGIRNY